MIACRKLQAGDAPDFYSLRLRGLRESPSAFSESAEEFEQRGPQAVEERMQLSWQAGGFIYGAFEGKKLLGMIGFSPEMKEKTKHIGSIWGMYVTSEARGCGLGKSLMQAVIVEAKRSGFEQLKLSVESENTAAVHLYEAMGFHRFGEEPRALKIDGKYFNETHMILLLQQARA